MFVKKIKNATLLEMKLDFSQIGIPEEELFGTEDELERALKSFDTKAQGFLSVLDAPIDKFLKFAQEKRELFDTVVVIGMGGSALGTRLLSDYFDNEKLLVLDTLDPYAVEKVLKSVNMVRTLWIVVSKSGNTLETNTLKKLLSPGIPAKNWVVISEKESALWKWAEEKGCPPFEMPRDVGGRFSVLSSVGMLPAAIAGLPIDKIIAGAKKMRQQALCKDAAKNPAWQIATAIESFGRKKIVHWAYCFALKSFGAWWTQLVAESLGKKDDGIIPLAALGPNDQHSLLQLVTEGEDDFFNIFVRDTSIERSPLGKIMNIELRATAQSLTELGRPSCIIDISNRNADTLGQLIVLWEMTIAFLGELRGINVFDQPGVERGKALTQEIIKAQE
jgi:glucose-6-phosphate isomerase